MRYYKVSITEIVSTPECKIPKSKAVVELPGRQENEEKAQDRARRAADAVFMPVLSRKKRVEKISYEVTPIDKPASLPRGCIISVGKNGRGRATIWLVLDE
jgi:hypothetical protein